MDLLIMSKLYPVSFPLFQSL
nr:envelope membrane protein [Schisandra propinqua subsp. sinensis]